MVKHYREGKSEESLGFEGVRVKSISERHHQKPETLVSNGVWSWEVMDIGLFYLA